MTRRLIVGTGIAAAAVGAVHLALGGYVARRLIAPRAAKPFVPVEIDGDTVSVPATAESRQPGTYGVWLDDGAHLTVGEIVRDDGARIVRSLVARPDGLADGPARGAWTSQSIGAPEEVGPTQHVAIPLRRGGDARAWVIGDPDAARWTIHVHGLRSSRSGALRSAPAAHDAGWTSLVVSYAGDEEAAPAEALPSSLGMREWRDVDDAISYAVEHGAREIVLVAWSMGATIAMLALEESRHRAAITGLVLVAPALDWNRIVARAVRGVHLPGSVGATALRVLESRLGSRVLGLIEAVDARALNWVDGPRPAPALPTLIVHSLRDPVVPVTGSTAYTARHPEASLVAFDATGHCNEANQDPERFRGAITGFLRGLPRAD
ncbi:MULTISPECIES: alpha/beta hydrolase [Microbacterium]|uniref:alpha/beta hydrolase n=1 Tax=Microbacterium TaxID=33882 RepID=UPI002780B476|nr:MULTISPECIES: alpha/beta hydrolase [Microbacterium]MDQ1075618.1 pimeloyl-ACP methyl ester carboxylesterase [Microbacterium sp. SORGH_AS_0969]MDQ1115857.1 pimeloyl-ACP methyl ester carboxylesterase [Microbacterium testaceum]